MRNDRQVRVVAAVSAASLVAAVLLACGAEHDESGGGAEEHVRETREKLSVVASSDLHVRGGSPDKNYGTAPLLSLRESGPRRALVRFSDADVQSFSSRTRSP